MVSIVIPTLNEEKNLPRLLESIAEQSFRDYEIIVADAESEDRTRRIAEEYGCRITGGGRPPGVGRNKGAEKARGSHILFLDADVVLPHDFLKDFMEEFEKRNLSVGSCYSLPLTDKKVDYFLYGTVNWYFRAVQLAIPHAPGYCIMVKREIHEKIGGFDERIKLAEDMDYVRRAAKFGRFRYLKQPRMPVSVRRLETDGRVNISLKYVAAELYILFFKKIRSDMFRYKFNHYGKGR